MLGELLSDPFWKVAVNQKRLRIASKSIKQETVGVLRCCIWREIWRAGVWPAINAYCKTSRWALHSASSSRACLLGRRQSLKMPLTHIDRKQKSACGSWSTVPIKNEYVYYIFTRIIWCLTQSLASSDSKISAKPSPISDHGHVIRNSKPLIADSIDYRLVAVLTIIEGESIYLSYKPIFICYTSEETTT